MNAVVVDRVVLGFFLNTCRFGHRLLLAVTKLYTSQKKLFTILVLALLSSILCDY